MGITGNGITGGGGSGTLPITSIEPIFATIANDDTLNLGVVGEDGWCEVEFGSVANAKFGFKSDGTIKKQVFSSDFSVVKNTAGKFNIYSEAGDIVFQNKTGGDLDIMYSPLSA